MSTEKQKHNDSFEQLEEATISTEQFIEKNQKMLIRIVLIIIVIIAAIFGYQKFYKIPRGEEALRQMFMAENYFAKDSFNLALNGDSQYKGFLDIAEEYSSTPSGNLAKYYAGLCYLYLGDYNNAITYLEKFSSSDLIFSDLVKANIGDAYMQLGDYKKAADYYNKAANGNTIFLQVSASHDVKRDLSQCERRQTGARKAACCKLKWFSLGFIMSQCHDAV